MLQVRCAWCDRDMGTKDSPHDGITHGICPECFDGMVKGHHVPPTLPEAVETIWGSMTVGGEG